MTKPLFSVCVDLYNREASIEKVLESICTQTCSNFELIIVDNGSTDNSYKIANSTLKRFPNVNYKLIKQGKKNNEIDGWNSPIGFAIGEYIAICEGDDYYNRDHLLDAKQILEIESNVGLYVAGSKLSEFQTSYTVINSDEAIHKLKTFSWCPPPSCIIFPRQTPLGEKFEFDTNFVWAAEYSLYLSILSFGFNVIENKTENYIDRGYRFYLKNDKHIADMLRVRYLLNLDYSKDEVYIANKKIFQTALHLFITNLVYFKFNHKLLSIYFEHFEFNFENICLTVKTIKNSFFQSLKSRINSIRD